MVCIDLVVTVGAYEEEMRSVTGGLPMNIPGLPGMF